MEKLKFYINDESKLNEYEREHKKISYATLTEYLFSDMILCNDITKLYYNSINTEYIEPEFEVGTDYDEESDTYTDIYQYYIVNYCNPCTYDFIKKYCNDEIILQYIDFLDLTILCVDHCGTSWNYVLTDFEYTTDYEESMQNKLYEEI